MNINYRYENILQRIADFRNYEQKVTVPYQSKSFDLEQFKSFLTNLGSPHLALPAVLIAGTTGKGSTGIFLKRIVQEAGYKVGFFSSPHLVDLRERIMIGEKKIPRKDFVKWGELILRQIHFQALQGKGSRTFFEFLTALAIVYFQEQKVDLAIFEVGVGGRLDATNVFRPLVSLITPIGIDHVHWLGRTKPAIAREKAGIIHQGSTVISVRQAAKVNTVINERARVKRTRTIQEGRDYRILRKKSYRNGCRFTYISSAIRLPDIFIPLAGLYQCSNAGLAISAAVALSEQGYHINSKHIVAGSKKVQWPGRLQYLKIRDRSSESEKLVILDGAHNPISIRSLVKTIKEMFVDRDIIVIVGISRDKDVKAIIKALQLMSHSFIVTGSDNPRAVEPEKLVGYFSPEFSVSVQKNPLNALRKAFVASKHGDLILITGSLHLVGNILKLLARSPDYYSSEPLSSGVTG